MGHPQHTVAIFAPVISLTVTVESPRENDSDEIHFHPGGQGFWVARMLRHLGERPLICGPIGGESGKVIRGLLPQWGIDLSPIEIDASSAVTIQDRRSGEREGIADASPPPLDRHSADEFYGAFLDRAISAGTAVIAGQVGGVLQLRAARWKDLIQLHNRRAADGLERGLMDVHWRLLFVLYVPAHRRMFHGASQ
jgi:fructose-1-phosphate kinase PfkB-like protein